MRPKTKRPAGRKDHIPVLGSYPCAFASGSTPRASNIPLKYISYTIYKTENNVRLSLYAFYQIKNNLDDYNKIKRFVASTKIRKSGLKYR